MNVRIDDWLLLTFFLFSLLLVVKLRSITSSEGVSAHRQAIGGTAVFTLLALGRLFQNQGLLRNIPFLSEPIFFQLVTWIAIISGGTLLLSGVFHWLPVYREHRLYNQRRIRRLGLLKKTEQLVGIEGRIDSLLSTTLNGMVEHYGFKEGAVFRIALADRTLVLTASTMDPDSEATTLEKATFDDRGWQQYINAAPDAPVQIVTGLKTSAKTPPIVLPIHLGSRPLGLFLLWHDKNTEVDHDDELTLRIIADIIARRMERDMIKRQHIAAAHRYKRRLDLKQAVEKASNLKDAMIILTGAVREIARADIISLTLNEENRNHSQRLSSGENGTVLLEQRLSAPMPGSLVEHLCRNEQSILVTDLQEDGRFESDDLVKTHRLKSLIAVPCRTSRHAAAMVVGSRQTRSFTRMQERRLRELGSVISQIIVSEEMRLASMTSQRHVARLNGLLTHVAASPSLTSVCEYAARLLSEEADADIVRISRRDSSSAFLESLALEVKGHREGMIPADGVMVLSLMPLHQELLESANEIRIEANESKEMLSEAELNQIFSGPLGSVCLLPVTVNGDVVSVIAIANRPDSRPFERQELLYAATVAEILAVAFKLLDRQDSEGGGRTRLAVGGRIARRNPMVQVPQR